MSGPITFFPPGTSEYVAATTPDNSTAIQRPAFVVRPANAAEVSASVVEAARRGLGVIPQATGHGAGGELAGDTVILDTSALIDLVIDPNRRTASAGAGLTWGAINAQAEKHGLLGRAGSSPTVAICGFTFGGGFGWLTRPHGTASSALLAVEYVDGAGRIRLAAEDAADPMDRDALWAFRGGGGVGIATRLEFDLVPVSDLHAGYLLWPIDQLSRVVDAWAAALPTIGDSVTTSISVLHTPPAPVFPEKLRGVPVVHLAIASCVRETGAVPLLERVRSAAPPAVDTWGPADAAKLATIHLDPPSAVPALGDARWLSDGAPGIAAAILAHAADGASPLAMVEIRHLGNHAATRPGAQTATPGSFALHSVGALANPADRGPINDALAAVREEARSVDLGLSLGSWAEGSTSVPDALAPNDLERVALIADAVDPHGHFRRSRYLV